MKIGDSSWTQVAFFLCIVIKSGTQICRLRLLYPKLQSRLFAAINANIYWKMIETPAAIFEFLEASFTCSHLPFALSKRQAQS